MPGHGIRLSAQDDTWATTWSRRSGIPSAIFQLKYNQLRNQPAQQHHFGPIGYHSPRTTSRAPDRAAALREARKAFTAAKAIGGAFGARLSSFRNYLQHLAFEYLRSEPGPDNIGPNSIHRRVRRLASGEHDDFTLHELERLHQVLEYRMRSMATADTYLEIAEIPFPGGARCCRFGWYLWTIYRNSAYGTDRVDRVCNLFATAPLFNTTSGFHGTY